MTGEPGHPDPKALRALAHPLRWKLIDVLGSENGATATRCAELLGESVASCSYHLGMLAKYGYIEEVPDRPGREKPWRLTRPDQQLTPPGLDLDGELAAEAALDVFLDHELDRTKSRVRSGSLEPAPWRPGLQGMTAWLTEAEFVAVKQQLIGVLEQFAPRARDASLRPESGREVRLFVAASAARPTPAGEP
ncbi:MAG: ArsR/SmtB family transcription factor [Streptosporangiaceae bacterium]|jgi:DNA-binding MarR family transcriptional regulator